MDMIATAVRAALLAAAALTMAPPLAAQPAYPVLLAAGEPTSRGTELRVTLNRLFGEHAALAARATGAAVGGRREEFLAAAGALENNTLELAMGLGQIYGPEAEAAFLPQWSSHVAFLVEYTEAAVAGNAAGKQAAAGRLHTFANDFGAFLNSANPQLPRDTAAGLLREHVTSLTAVVDAQASGNFTAAFAAERTAYRHMAMIADALAEAIVRQFPQFFM